jgi:hypothetical protein
MQLGLCQSETIAARSNEEEHTMTHPHKSHDKAIHDEKQPAELSELTDLVASLPPEYKARFQPALERAVENIARRRRILSFIQEALSQLRLDMKYLMFDLEATRRERDDYRRKLEETS